MTTAFRPIVDNELLSKAVAAILEREPEAEIILFGSRATGSATADSDYDLLVVAETQDRYRTALELTRVLRRVFELPGFDLIVIPRADWDRVRHMEGYVAREADRNGVRLGAGRRF